MKNWVFAVLVGGAVIASGTTLNRPAMADWYGSIQAGANWLEDADVTATAGPFSASGSIEFDTGWGVAAALGRSFSSGLRVEGELNYRKNDLDSASGVSLDGDVDALGIMGNVWYDFKTGGSWKPYIGGGIGVAEVGIDLNSAGGVATPYSDEDWVFAYQLGAGVAFPIATNTMLSVDYRFFATSDPEFEDAGVTVEAESRSHTLMLGLRFGF